MRAGETASRCGGQGGDRAGRVPPASTRVSALPALGAGPQPVTLRAGGGGVEVSHRFGQPGEATLVLPLALADLPGRRLLDLLVDTDRLQTPQALGLGDDRLPGVGLRRIPVEPADDATGQAGAGAGAAGG